MKIRSRRRWDTDSPTHLHWDQVRWEDIDQRHGSYRMNKVLSFIPKGGFHLDVGTGNGDGTLLASKIANCIGIDYGYKSLSIAASKGCKVIQADARRLVFKDAIFDSVTCLDALEHIPNPEQVVSEVFRVLKKGGIFILQTPDSKVLKERLQRFVRKLGFGQKQPYDKSLPLAELRRLIGSAGFNIEYERPMQYWDDNPLIHLISWSFLFLCRKN